MPDGIHMSMKMNQETGHDDENCVVRPLVFAVDKMVAVVPLPKSQADHELRITDVEGAFATEPPVVIELDDGEDDDTSMATTVQTELRNRTAADKKENENETNEESMPCDNDRSSTKEEPSSDAETCGSYNGPDPLGLLERMDKNVEVEDIDYECSEDESGSNISVRRLTKEERWQQWMKRWEWLLHEQSDGDYAFCLFCNVYINVNQKVKFIKQHSLSLYHQERENNYVAFKNSEEQMRGTISANELKHELGTNSYVAAMKQKRVAEGETLNNFNWLRWLQWHPWLERVQVEGTIGLCKYCNMRLNVEFVYLRKRHESGLRHQEAIRQNNNKGMSRKRKRSDSATETSTAENEGEESELETESNDERSGNSDGDWLELMAGTTPQQCRCTLCDCKMVITSFSRHCKTKVHVCNLQAYLKKQTLRAECGIWAQYADKHPWLVADPRDPSLAYCNVCFKRFMYGHSEIKRKTHENSSNHVAALAAASTANSHASNTEQQQEDKVDQSKADAEEEASDQDYNDQADKNENGSKRVSTEDTSYAKTKTTKSIVRHFAWLRFFKDRKMQMCKYCRVRIYTEAGKLRHDQSAHHRKTLQEFKAQQLAMKQERRQQQKAAAEEEGDNNNSVNAANNASERLARKPAPVTMQGKVMVWKERYPWLSYKRNEIRPNYGWCKLCDMSVFLPSFKFASKHQRTNRHVRLRLERKRTARLQSMQQAEAVKEAAAQISETKNRAAMTELQLKYDWLEPDANDENYGHCKQCDTRLPIKVFYLRQHHSSRKHTELLQQQQHKSNSATTSLVLEPEMSITEGSPTHDDVVSIKSESSYDEPEPKRIRRTVDVRRILRALRNSVGRRPEERSQFDLAKDMICSSFDIVSRLRALESQTQQPLLSVEQAAVINSPVSPHAPRNTIDLFFESITQTMKSLPIDLVAEGKAKIMQITSDLEVRALRRTEQVAVAVPAAVAPLPEQPAPVTQEQHGNHSVAASTETWEDIAGPCSPLSSVSSAITIEDLDESTAAQSNSNDVAKGPITERKIVFVPKRTPPPSSNTTHAASNGAVPRHSKEPPVTHTQGTVPPAGQSDETDVLRCVPLNKLKPPHTHNSLNVPRNQNLGINTSTPVGKRSQILVTAALASPPVATHNFGEMTANGGLIRKIRVSNGNHSQLITIQNQALHQPQQQSPIIRAAAPSSEVQKRTLNHHLISQVTSNRPMQPSSDKTLK